MDTPVIVPADVAFMLVATALVLLMTPALAFFYGGLVRSKNALNTMMMSVAALGFVGVAWALLGYSLAFAAGSPGLGDLSKAFLAGVGLEAQGTIPQILFMAYQGTFAIITAALISGAIVERMRFFPYLVFITLWSLVVYAPIAHWVWGGGFLAKLGALDFAGGTVVHVNAATAALVAALVIGQRKDYARQAILPHNVPFVLLGAGLLWFGWFGFNAGSALAANGIASLAFVNTMLAPAATLVVWTLARSRPQPQGDRRGRRDRDRGRPGGDHAGGRLHFADGGAGARRGRGVPELLRAGVPRAHRARRLARRGGGARRRRHGGGAAHRRPRVEGLERHGRRPALRQPRPARHPGGRCRRDDRLQRRWRATCCSSSSTS